MMNQIALSGWMVAPAISLPPVDGLPVCKFTMGYEFFEKKEKKRAYIVVTCIAKLAMYVFKKGCKGANITVGGKLLKHETLSRDGNYPKNEFYISATEVEIVVAYNVYLKHKSSSENKTLENDDDLVYEQTKNDLKGKKPF